MCTSVPKRTKGILDHLDEKRSGDEESCVHDLKKLEVSVEKRDYANEERGKGYVQTGDFTTEGRSRGETKDGGRDPADEAG